MSFACAIASSSVANRRDAGDRAERLVAAHRHPAVTPVSTVGWKNVWPSSWREPPRCSSAPRSSASATCALDLLDRLPPRSAGRPSRPARCRRRPSAPRPPRRAARGTRRRSPSWTKIRFAEMQVWPELRNLQRTVPATASSRSASSKTMNGALPPSSSEIFFSPFAHWRHQHLPDLGRAGEADLADERVRGHLVADRGASSRRR